VELRVGRGCFGQAGTAVVGRRKYLAPADCMKATSLLCAGLAWLWLAEGWLA